MSVASMNMSNSDRDSLKPTIPSAPARQASARSCSTQVFRRTGSHSVRTVAIGVYGYGGDVVGNRSSAQPAGRLGRRAPMGVTRELARHAPASSAHARGRTRARSRARHSAGNWARLGHRARGRPRVCSTLRPQAGCDGGGGQLGARAGIGGVAAARPVPGDAGDGRRQLRARRRRLADPLAAADLTRLAGRVALGGRHCPAPQAKPGEQIGSQARSGRRDGGRLRRRDSRRRRPADA